MRRAGVLISLSFDATSIAPPNMFETMRFTWNMGITWRGTPLEDQPPVGFRDVIAMATINGARALGLGDVTGSLTVGKRAGINGVRGSSAALSSLQTQRHALFDDLTLDDLLASIERSGPEKQPPRPR